MATLEIDYQPEVDRDHCTARISLKPKSVDRDATLSVICQVNVKDSRPVNESQVLFNKSFRTTSVNMEVKMPVRFRNAYSYVGHQIDVAIVIKLGVNDAWIFDSKAEDILPKQAFQRPAVTSSSKALTDPHDAYSLNRNFGAISASDKIKTVMALLGGVFLTVGIAACIPLLMLGSMEKVNEFMDKAMNQGMGLALLPMSLPVIVIVVVAVMLMRRLLRKQLRGYMTFEQQTNLRIDKYRSYAMSDLVRGKARIPLNNARLRVVAYNIEKGQYRRGSGTNVRTVSFGTPVNGLLLYDETVDQIPARTEIARSFPGTVAFDDMFRQLYPPQMLGAAHGLQAQWEVQLILDDLVDQEMIGDANTTRYADFLEG